MSRVLLSVSSGDVQQLRCSYANVRKMSSPAVISSSALYTENDDESAVSDDRLSPLSFASAPTHHSGRRQQRPSRASFSSLDQLPSSGPSVTLKKSSSSTPKSSIPRPNSASKFPIQRKSVPTFALSFVVDAAIIIIIIIVIIRLLLSLHSLLKGGVNVFSLFIFFSLSLWR